MTFMLNFDLVIICYFIAPFVVFVFLRDQSGKEWKAGYTFFRWYFFIVFSICSLICAADIPFFIQFGSHLNKTIFNWSGNTGFVTKLIFSNISYWGYLLLFLLMCILFYRFLKQIFSNVIIEKRSTGRGASIVLFILLGLFTFIGIRGRTSPKSPILAGTAFFCEYPFFNQAGLNPCFVFFNDLMEKDQTRPFLLEGYSDTDLKRSMWQLTTTKYYTQGEKNERIYECNSPAKNYNVVIVLMESMSISKLGYYGSQNLAPSLDSIAQAGLFFDHFYSSGIHTFNGLFATSTGFPSIMDEHPLNTYTDRSMKGIAYWLKKQNYSTYFFTSHDPQFDNMEGFFKTNNFDEVLSEDDMPSEEALGPMGIPDHHLFDFVLEKIDRHEKEKKNAPFLSFVLTASDHGPWEIPADIPFKPGAASKQDKATQYADWSIGQFIRKAKTREWFNNTLFIFVADHGGYYGFTYAMPLSYNHIPCVFYMPSAIQPDTISSVGGQIDVLPTLMGFMNIPFTNRSMGIDLRREVRPCMYFTADNKIGCIDEKDYYYELMDEQKEEFFDYRQLDLTNRIDENRGKADSMKSYSRNMIRTARYILKNKLY
ncbi:MAG: LTA synthase family protein [Bacteroidia bacterium]